VVGSPRTVRRGVRGAVSRLAGGVWGEGGTGAGPLGGGGCGVWGSSHGVWWVGGSEGGGAGSGLPLARGVSPNFAAPGVGGVVRG